MKKDEIREAVRIRYREVAVNEESTCSCAPSCCDSSPSDAAGKSRQMGYTAEDVLSIPQGANMGLGCGNPQAIAALVPGETVLDLGSGGGFDCFLASRQVGESGRVIGVDMTSEMIAKARSNAQAGEYTNVEFRLGEIENLPVADNTVDVIISNCVVNLSPDKERVFVEAFRVLKPGGRVAISDVVAFADLPEDILNDLKLLTGCIAGASTVNEVQRMLSDAGFSRIRVTPKSESASFIRDWAPGTEITRYVVSANIEAVKPV